MHSSSRKGAKVKLLALHSTEGIMRATDLRDWKAWAGSSHAAADADGVLLSGARDGFVDYGLASWTLRAGNPVSDNLEMCALAKWTRAEWLARPKLLDRAAFWLAERSKARGIPLVKLSPADVRAGKSGVIGHVDWTKGMSDGTHWDPGTGFPWDVVLATANEYRKPKTIAPEDDEMTPTEKQQLADVWARLCGPNMARYQETGDDGKPRSTGAVNSKGKPAEPTRPSDAMDMYSLAEQVKRLQNVVDGLFANVESLRQKP